MRPDIQIENLIIGAGPCGIGAAHRLKNLGKEFLVIEKKPYVGGLATSFVDDMGFTWDIGGHVQFSHYKYFDEAMIEALGADGWFHHQRESWVWMKDTFVPYPFQNNIHRLPEHDREECLNGLVDNEHSLITPKNFKEWLLKNFGNGITKHFLFPYNYKVWAFKPEQLNSSWVGERVSTINIDRIRENIKLMRDDVSWGPNSTFQFPKVGGTGEIWASLAKKIGLGSFRLNSEVIYIDPKQKIAKLENGINIKYENILSTIPVNQLCDLTEGVPNSIVKEASDLKFSSSHIVGIGLEGKLQKELESKCWMYFPENDCPFYRVTVFSNYSPNNVPDISKQFSLMCETSESTDKRVNSKSIIEQTIEGLKNTKLITDKDKIISKWHFKARYGYPTPSLSRDKILNSVITHLDNLGIYSRGRFGAWKYEISNQDHTFMQGVEWVEKIYQNIPEKTFQL